MPGVKFLVVLAFVVNAVCLMRPSGASTHHVTPRANRGSAVSAAIANLHHKPSAIFCSCNGISGRDLVFDLLVRNPHRDPRVLHAFVWATNDSVSPPERGLWPVAAVDSCLTESGELRITDGTAGSRITVPGRGTVRLAGNTILEPPVWFDGKPVRFRTLRIELWSAEEGRVFQNTVDLVRSSHTGVHPRKPRGGV